MIVDKKMQNISNTDQEIYSKQHIVFVIPGGGGKTTLTKVKNYIDIDTFWDKNGAKETKMTTDWLEAKNQGDQNRVDELVNECMLLKANLCKQSLNKKDQPSVILVQSYEQANIITEDEKRVIGLVPSTELHEKSMTIRNDVDWVKDLCRKQRENIINSKRDFSEYNSFLELKQRIKSLVYFDKV